MIGKPISRLLARKRSMIYAASGMALLVILIAVPVSRCGSDPRNRALSQGPFFPTAKGPLTINVTETGTINPSKQEIIKNELQGRTTILYLIPEGARVKEGDLLVELDASNLEDSKVDQEIRVQNAEAAFIQSRENLEVVKNQAQSNIDTAELTLRFAKEDLDQYRNGEYPNALKEHEARITLAQEELQRAKEKLKWSEILFNEKYLAESELQADRLASKKAALDLDLANNNLTLLKDFTYKRNITKQESDIKQAEMALEREKRKASANTVQAETDLRAKESEFKRQKDKLDKIKDQIAKARIVAPRDGLVVYATSARFNWRGNSEPLEEGQEVRERQELIHLPTASAFKVEVKVHESNLDKIRIGLAVRITMDAVPGRQFAGHVTSIAPLPDATSMFMNPDLKVYNTEIMIDGGSDVLRTGMSCRAEIIVEHYDSALYVPVQAVTRVNGRPTVFVLDKSGVNSRRIEIGYDNNRMVHVLGGLQEGERVLLAPPLDAGDQAANRNPEPPAAEFKLRPVAGDAAPAPAHGPAENAGTDREKDYPPADPEIRRKIRERIEKMPPEEREELRKRLDGELTGSGRK